ncbi:hypothetical protein FSP39_012631 [Pinctada imbricata]|uniref:Uncharacterized protein n=1 Tax=Pinctada imbricata TaxID=66713 RepID=A0AA88XM54_PINIB|nr:hypothetical protein FSP39_012631 [Pinctada imbricata]
MQELPCSDVHGDTSNLATTVFALMKENETKLIRQANAFVKKNKSRARQIFETVVDGWTPLHACALRGSKKLLKTMLGAGSDINIRMGHPEGLPDQCTLLHIACHRGDLKICELLLSRGADVTSKDGNCRTPVYYAAKRRHKRVIKLLEKKGADVSNVEKWAPNISNECETPLPTTSGFCFFW